MRKKNIGIYTILTISLLSLISCNKDKSDAGVGKGSFTLSVITDNRVTPVLRSATEADALAPEADEFAITLTQEDGDFAHTWESIADVPADDKYEIGIYSLSAVYGSADVEGFDAPYYYGDKRFAIRDGEVTKVDVVCSLQQAKVTLRYTDAFKNYFTAYDATIRTSKGSEIVYSQEENRSVYVTPGDISLKLQLTNYKGATALYEPAKIKNAHAGEHYIVTFDVSDQSGEMQLSIVFDNTTQQEPITINVSNEAMVAPAPFITLGGVAAGGTVTLQEYERVPSDELGATIVARGGLSGCKLTAQSSYLQSMGLPLDIELGEMTPEQTQLLESMGLVMVGFGANASTMGYIDFVPFTPSLQIAEDGSEEHTFTLTARDVNGKVSEPVSFTIHNTPLTLELGDMESVFMGSHHVQVPVVCSGYDMDRLAVYAVSDGVAKRVPYSILSNNENNYLLQADIEMGNKPQEVQVAYSRRTTPTKSVDVTVPEYTLKCEPYDVWSTHAVINVEAQDPAYQDVIEKYVKLYINESGGWNLVASPKDERGYQVSGLTGGRTYNMKSSCLADGSDLSSSKLLRFVTETALTLPNADFESWSVWFSETINKGGRYGVIAGMEQETTTLTSSQPTGWATVNTKTIPQSPATKNSWYMAASTLPVQGVSGNGAMMRNVGWDNAGSTPPQGTWGLSQSLNSLSIPSIANHSVGKMFLGTYSYNHRTGVEIYNEGISFASRPSKLTGYYKYIPQGGDKNGVVTISVENRTSGVVTVLAVSKYALNPVSDYTYFEVPLTYTVIDKSATHLNVMFASSNKASSSQASESNSIITVDNKSQAVSTGSELYVDMLSLTY